MKWQNMHFVLQSKWFFFLKTCGLHFTALLHLLPTLYLSALIGGKKNVFCSQTCSFAKSSIIQCLYWASYSVKNKTGAAISINILLLNHNNTNLFNYNFPQIYNKKNKYTNCVKHTSHSNKDHQQETLHVSLYLHFLKMTKVSWCLVILSIHTCLITF